MRRYFVGKMVVFVITVFVIMEVVIVIEILFSEDLFKSLPFYIFMASIPLFMIIFMLTYKRNVISVEVDESGITLRSPLHTVRYPWKDIITVYVTYEPQSEITKLIILVTPDTYYVMEKHPDLFRIIKEMFVGQIIENPAVYGYS